MIARADRPGLLFAAIGAAGLALPLVEFRANRIVAGETLGLAAALPWGAAAWAALALVWAAGILRLVPWLRLVLAVAGIGLLVAALGAAADGLAPERTLARVSPASGFWLTALALGLMAADALTRMRPGLWLRWLLLAASVAGLALILGSGVLDGVSVMREYAARHDIFAREALRHVVLAFGSLGLALAAGLPLGIALAARPGWRRPVLSALNVMQTVPSLALFGIMIPIFGWIAASFPALAAAGVSGIGPFPALVALFLYALLPVVANSLTGLTGADPAAVEAARGLGMTPAQVMTRVRLPLALPVLLAAVRIVLVQNIGLAVIAGLIGGGGFGTFVFQGLNQTAMDLVLLGALPTIALALVAGIAMDLAVAASRKGRA